MLLVCRISLRVFKHEENSVYEEAVVVCALIRNAMLARLSASNRCDDVRFVNKINERLGESNPVVNPISMLRN